MGNLNTLPARLQDLNIQGKKVLVRVDLNVPIDDRGIISDDTRIQMSIPTIRALQKKGAARIILMSHLGRPEGKDPSLSLKPVATRLSELIHEPVLFLPDCVGPEVNAAIDRAANGAIILLENLRFHEGEEKPKKEPDFVEKLARLGDFYINDAFGTAHRAHASTALIANFFQNKRGIGLLMEQEIRSLGEHLSHPKRPFSAIIGGAKISTKIGVLTSLLDKVDLLFIGGAMSYTFFRARGIPIGDSLVELDMLEMAQKIEKTAQTKKIPLFLPRDVVTVQKIALNAPSKIAFMDNKGDKQGIDAGWEGVDIGPKTIAEWTPEIQKSHTVFWNGPVGVFETKPFDQGTNAIAKLLASMKESAYTVIGGGDSVSAIQKLNLASSISHISTGGGASLEFIEQGTLPGIEALR